MTNTSGALTDKASDGLKTRADQQRFWNEWNAKHRGSGYDLSIDPPTLKRRDTVVDWIRQLALDQPRILDLGCATGWLSDQLVEFGQVVGTDIADESINEARQRYPHIRFQCEDFVSSNGGNEAFDIVVSLETLSHVGDQRTFIRRIRDVLRPRGFLILTTQNRTVFERRSSVGPPAAGQVRHWLSRDELRGLLRNDFTIRRFTTLSPEGDLGFLRLVNSTRLNRLLGRLVSRTLIDRTKERLGLGQTIAVLAQRN